MTLNHDKNWKAVHFEGRTILKIDRSLYPQAAWEQLVNRTEVEPMKEPGHYRAIAK